MKYEYPKLSGLDLFKAKLILGQNNIKINQIKYANVAACPIKI
jgi:hypothetical protein